MKILKYYVIPYSGSIITNLENNKLKFVLK